MTGRFAVLGAGMQGRAIAHDFLNHASATGVGIADIDGDKAAALAASFRDARAVATAIDLEERQRLVRYLSDFDAVVSAVPYRYNSEVARAAIEARVHFVDLGGNDSVTRDVLSLDQDAKRAGVTLVPDQGLAPGLAGLLGTDLVRGFSPPRRLELRVGGLPQSLRPPLDYQLVFSVSGLLNEYLEPCRVLRNGRPCLLEPLTELEPIAFDAPFDALEAFHTSGGASTLVDTLLGEVDDLDYKTIRYQGHCERLRLLRDLGYFAQEPVEVDDLLVSPRALTERLWSERLAGSGPDVVLLRIIAGGSREGRLATVSEELVAFPDAASGLSAMARCTGYPAAIVASMAVAGQLGGPGARAAERSVPLPLFRAELLRRGLATKSRRAPG